MSKKRHRSPTHGQVWTSHNYPDRFLLQRAAFHRPLSREIGQSPALHRRVTLPEELPVGTWFATQIHKRQRCQVQRSIEIPINDQTTGRIATDIDAFRERLCCKEKTDLLKRTKKKHKEDSL